MLISYTALPKIIALITATREQEIIETATLYQRVATLFYFIVAEYTLE